MSRKRKLQCLVIGPISEPELRDAIGWLTSQPLVEVHFAPDALSARRHPAAQVDLLLFVQSHPGQFSRFQVESLHQTWPLGILVFVFGNWCEGEARSGRPPGGVWRIPASSLREILDPLFTGNKTSAASLRAVPRLSTEAERLECETRRMTVPLSGNVLIVSPTLAGFEALAAALAPTGCTCLWQTGLAAWTGGQPSAIVLDVLRGDAEDWAQIEEFARSWKTVPLLVTMGFPRADDRTRAAAMSARRASVEILAKPFRISELDSALNRLIEKSGADGRVESAAKSA